MATTAARHDNSAPSHLGDPHEVDFKAWAHRVATKQAEAYHRLLGEGWTLDGYWVSKGEVAINTMAGTISWLDLAPAGGTRQRQWIRLGGGQSQGATIAIARALAELEDEHERPVLTLNDGDRVTVKSWGSAEFTVVGSAVKRRDDDGTMRTAWELRGPDRYDAVTGFTFGDDITSINGVQIGR